MFHVEHRGLREPSAISPKGEVLARCLCSTPGFWVENVPRGTSAKLKKCSTWNIEVFESHLLFANRELRSFRQSSARPLRRHWENVPRGTSSLRKASDMLRTDSFERLLGGENCQAFWRCWRSSRA